MVLDLEFLAHFPHHFIIQIGVVVCDNLPWQPISADSLPLDEPDHHTPHDASVRGNFDPLDEVIDRNQDETMYVRSFGLYGPNHIYPSHGKGPRHGQYIQWQGRSVDIVRKHLAFVTLPYMEAQSLSMVSQ